MADSGHGTNATMSGEVGHPAAAAVLAHAEGRWSEVVETLLPIRRRTNLFDGSHTKRDLLARTLTDAAVRSGRLDLARALLSERVVARPTSTWGWAHLAEVHRRTARPGAAHNAGSMARRAQERFSAAVPPVPIVV